MKAVSPEEYPNRNYSLYKRNLISVMLRNTVCASVPCNPQHGGEQDGFGVCIAGKNIIWIYLINTAQWRFTVKVVDLPCAFV